MEKIILFMDNNPKFLDVHAQLLERAGYRVLRASTVAEAEAALSEQRVHLAILDIRMEDEDDENDLSGLVLAQQPAYQAIPKILLTAHTRGEKVYKIARRTLFVSPSDPPPIAHFIAKDDGFEDLKQAVEDVFEQWIHINRSLEIHWEGQPALQHTHASFAHLVALLEPELDSAHTTDRASELEDLFRKLFYEHSQITIGRLLALQRGQVLLEVFAYGKAAGQFAVACGHKASILEADANYSTFVMRGNGTLRTVKVATETTPQFAATSYVLAGAEIEAVATMGDWARGRSAAEVTAALDELYKRALTPWHRSERFHEASDKLGVFYPAWLQLSEAALSPEFIAQQAKAICAETLAAGLEPALVYVDAERTIGLEGADHSYPLPLARSLAQGCATTTLWGISHGQVDLNTVLVDSSGAAWLTNFGQIGRGPLARDFVLLETSVKALLLGRASLATRHAIERRLLDDVFVEQDLAAADDLPSEAIRVLRIVRHIRGIAAGVAGRDPHAYLYGLFFCVARFIATYRPGRRHSQRELIQYAHALLTAAMLHKQLASNVEASAHIPARAHTQLWFERRNSVVWVEGKPATLTPQEFSIFNYLHAHVGNVCSRQELAQGALGSEYDISEESRFNSAMSRLRQKIEPDSEHPKYIVNVRGRGYKLVLDRVYLPPEDVQE